MIHRHLERLIPAVATAAVVVVIGLSGCQYTTIDNSSIVAPPGPVSYSNDVLPVLMKGCDGFGCHFGYEASGVELSSYDYTVASIGTQYGSLVVKPGDGASSPLVDKLLPNPEFGQLMPIGIALTASEINIIKTWIDEGALDN